MDPSILSQYEDLAEEIKDLQDECYKLERHLKEPVADAATGSMPMSPYTEVTYIIEGVPYDRRQLDHLRNRLGRKAHELIELRGRIEDELDTIADSEIRRIIRYRFIEEMTWIRVSNRMGWGPNEQRARRKFNKFIEMTKMTKK